MDMEQTRMAIEDVATLTVVDACAQAGQLKVGEDLMKGTLKNAPAVVSQMIDRCLSKTLSSEITKLKASNT